jgi:hypothetical protein
MFLKEVEVQLDESQKAEAERTLLNGVIDRASILFLLFGIGSFFYGFQTLNILKNFDPTITTYDNVVPRLLLSTLPSFLISFLMKKYLKSINLRVYLWVFGFPLIFLGTCLINVWPLILQGKLDVYIYFHAANMFCLTLSFLLIAPNLRLFLLHLSAFSVTFFIPLIIMLSKNKDLLNLFINDSISSLLISFVCARVLFLLRKQLTCYDIKFKEAVKPFLGKDLVDAIKNETLEALSNFKTKGIVLSLDLRGFTTFVKAHEREFVSSFMKEYHNILGKAFIGCGGYLHKSNGDGHLLSFAVMDEINLSDINVLKDEVVKSEDRKINGYLKAIEKQFPAFVESFNSLTQKYDIQTSLKIGAGIDVGDVKLALQGNVKTQMELDIEGEVIIRSNRLEAYSKVLNQNVDSESSFLILTPTAFSYLASPAFTEWRTDISGLAVRDYPDIKAVYFLKFENRSPAIGTKFSA